MGLTLAQRMKPWTKAKGSRASVLGPAGESPATGGPGRDNAGGVRVNESRESLCTTHTNASTIMTMSWTRLADEKFSDPGRASFDSW